MIQINDLALGKNRFGVSFLRRRQLIKIARRALLNPLFRGVAAKQPGNVFIKIARSAQLPLIINNSQLIINN